MSRATFTLLGLPVAALVLLAAVSSTPPGEGRPAAAPFQSTSFRFAKAPAGPPASEPGAPISLTASDGTGLALVALEVNGVLEPPLAFTGLRLTFENPRDQRIEGRFRIALPPGAALSRFAMKNDGGWMEGEVVERQRARVAYEDFLHRRQDPALLEQEAGNEFSARVFPIPARGRKELIVSYSHALPRADEPYVIPLHGLSEIGRLDLRVLLGGRPATGAPSSNLGGEVSERRVVELHKTDWTPDRDFEIGQDRVAGRAGLRHGNLVVARVAAPVEAVPQEISGLYVLIDSSASRALGYATQIRRPNELIAGRRDASGASTPAGDGAAWIGPGAVDGGQPGAGALVYADLPADLRVRVSLDGRAAKLGGEIAPTERPLLERAWAQGRIERLLHLRDTAPAGDEDLRRALTLQITEVSVKNRVISPFTAMLVLETEYDYARFGLDRRALADILTVGPGGLEVMARKGSDLPRVAEPMPSPKVEEELKAVGFARGGPGPTAQPAAVTTCGCGYSAGTG